MLSSKIYCLKGLATALASLAAISYALPTDPSLQQFVLQNGHQQAVFSAIPLSDHKSPSPNDATVLGFKSYPDEYWALEEGVGHFSEWSKAAKQAFLQDYNDGKASEWTLVMGNEGGDLDSMTSALTWAYHLSHSTLHQPNRRKAVALLQTPFDALDLRPENKLALGKSKMSSGHRDLLTIDELPESPVSLSSKIHGIVLVDHPVPLSVWENANVVSIFDHHTDHGAAPHAHPRIFGQVASCTSIVAKQMLNELEAIPTPPNGPGEYHMPHELLELILGAIAIDSHGLDSKKNTDADVEIAKRVLNRSNWHGQQLNQVMGRLNDELSSAKKDLSHLNVRDLLRRDWKGDVVSPQSPAMPTLHLGLASVPLSLDDQILLTPTKSVKEWFAIEENWTAEIGADVSLCLTSFKNSTENGKTEKVREIVLVVRHDRRIDDRHADHLFKTLSTAIESDPFLQVQPWHRANELQGRIMVWRHTQSNGGRKVIRPIVESAVQHWQDFL